MGTLLTILGAIIIVGPIIALMIFGTVLEFKYEKELERMEKEELEEKNQFKEELRKLTKREKKKLIKLIIEELESE